MQAQQAIPFPRRSFSNVVAIVATLLAAALALALVVTVERPLTSATPAVVTLHEVDAEQIAHNRSEQGLGGSGSIGGEQIAHNQSEQGFVS